MNINILLPYKEKFDKNLPSSVSSTIFNNFTKSRFKDNIKIYGRKVSNPLLKSSFIGIKPLFWFGSKNMLLAKHMCKLISKNGCLNNIVEMHNRPYLFKYVNKKLPNVPICIFFHNDPQDMKGSKTIKERYFLLQNAKIIYCVSKYIKKRFISGLEKNEYLTKVKVLYNGVERTLNKFPFKDKEILFVGRIVKEKGVDIYVKAVEILAKNHPDWKFSIVGSTYLGSYRNESTYAEFQTSKFDKIGNQTSVTGFLSPQNVQQKMYKSSIIVIPSIWKEPYGLVASEAMANGLAIVASKVGGLPEIIQNNGILIEAINVNKVVRELEKLMKEKKLLIKFQKLSWNNFNHTSKKSSETLDKFRSAIFKN